MCEVYMCTGILKKQGTCMSIHILVFLNQALKRDIVYFMCTGILNQTRHTNQPGTQTGHSNQAHKPSTQTRHTNQAYMHCISENYVPVQPYMTSTIIGQSVHLYVCVYVHVHWYS